MTNAIMSALVNGVLSIIGSMLNPGQVVPPSAPCSFDTPGIASSFLNFSCDSNSSLSVTDMDLVNSYLSCVLTNANSNFTDYAFSTCPNVTDVNVISALLANCYWCTSTSCLQVGGPYISNCTPVSLPPQPPSCLNLQFFLYTPLNTYNNPQELSADLSNIEASNFDFKENTSILIPGFLSLDIDPLNQDLVPAILNCSRQNVIAFDWGTASGPPYYQAIANARSAAITVANFIRGLNEKYNYSPSKVQLIGHSLGCHLAGLAGKAYPTIGRITGLDPAGPGYDCSPEMRLSPTDAVFVDVIHSDSGFFGTVNNLGDVDFWPNGGRDQPACNSSEITKNNKTYQTNLPCDHIFSITVYASSARFCQPAFNCSFQANMCSNYSDFQQGQCNSCGADGSQCAQMGHLAQNYAWAGYPLPAPQPFYLNTANFTPFCSVCSV